MRIAIPVSNDRLSLHFGHCEKFALIDVDQESHSILKHKEIAAPPHQPGLLPLWLGRKGVEVVIAGGLGSQARRLFALNNIKVLVGAPSDTPEHLTMAYLEGKLSAGENICDH
jgi:predicted Fe-Mo cluster-binding NifX family protein